MIKNPTLRNFCLLFVFPVFFVLALPEFFLGLPYLEDKTKVQALAMCMVAGTVLILGNLIVFLIS